MNVWIRGACGVFDGVPGSVDVLLARPRQPADDGPFDLRAIACTDSKSPGEVIGDPPR